MHRHRLHTQHTTDRSSQQERNLDPLASEVLPDIPRTITRTLVLVMTHTN